MDEYDSVKGAYQFTMEFLESVRTDGAWRSTKNVTDNINSKYNKSYSIEQVRRALRHIRDDKKPPLVMSYPSKSENDKLDIETLWRWI